MYNRTNNTRRNHQIDEARYEVETISAEDLLNENDENTKDISMNKSIKETYNLITGEKFINESKKDSDPDYSDDDDEEEYNDEENEKELDEISPNLALKYAHKATADVSKRISSNKPSDNRKIDNRMTGIKRVTKRLESVEEENEEELSEEEDRPREPVRTMLKRQIAAIKAKKVPVKENHDEGLENLMKEEVTLSEEFKSKAHLIFETAFNTRLEEEVEKLEEAYVESLKEEITSVKSDLVKKVNSYLNYIVEQWMENNKLAVDNGLRIEISESFMGKLKNLFEDHYISVPDSKVDLVDELAEKVETLENSLNESIKNNIKLTENIYKLKKKNIISECLDGLSLNEKTKLEKLAENVEFDSESIFKSKIEILKETYFPKKPKNQSASSGSDGILNENWESSNTQEVEIHDNAMKQYVNAISKIASKI